MSSFGSVPNGNNGGESLIVGELRSVVIFDLKLI